jgi:60 kDa SS-A/Ro ribonucleoprotein
MCKDERMGRYAVSRALGHSITGKASNNDYCLAVLALALTHGSRIVKADAEAALCQVARIGTHILHFTSMANTLRGWGSALKRSVAAWYLNKSVDDLAYHVAKYTQRDGWSHRDVLRLCHPKATSEEQNDLFAYICKGTIVPTLPTIILAKETLKLTESIQDAVKFIEAYNLPRECVPTPLLASAQVWEALSKKFPLGAAVRNLNQMTIKGVLKPFDTATSEMAARINDAENIRKARLHPMGLMFATKTYSEGKGDRGSLTWTPLPVITTALEQAFYKSFDSVEKSGKRFLLGIDISGSMSSSMIRGSNVSCRDASIAMALMTLRAEGDGNTMAIAFDHATKRSGRYPSYGRREEAGVRIITDLSSDLRMRDFGKVGGHWNGGATDCSLPMLYAIENNLKCDAFVVYTDNETWSGGIHPHVALKKYQAYSGIQAKLIVVGMTATEFSIAEPGNPDMLDVVGFSPDTPAIISAFARGEF